LPSCLKGHANVGESAAISANRARPAEMRCNFFKLLYSPQDKPLHYSWFRICLPYMAADGEKITAALE
jgi:hypothetical protein